MKISKNLVEVVQDLKILGVNIDNKLFFKKHVENTKCLVNRKIFSIKKLFYLSQSVKLQFFKTFILFCRLNIFFYKIVNKQIFTNCYSKLFFNDQLSLRNRELVHVPFERTKFGCIRLSIFLPNFKNNTLKNYIYLNFIDFLVP